MNTFKPGDLVDVLVRKGTQWSKGDLGIVVSISGEFVDLKDKFGGKRGKKGKNGTQRFHYTELKKD
jgi:hypothetical protein